MLSESTMHVHCTIESFRPGIWYLSDSSHTSKVTKGTFVSWHNDTKDLYWHSAQCRDSRPYQNGTYQ